METKNKKLTFWQQEDDLWWQTTVKIATTNHSYISVHGRPVTYGGLDIRHYHLCGLGDGLPMHFTADLTYFVEKGDWAAVHGLMPDLADGEDGARACFMEAAEMLRLVPHMDVPEHVRKTLKEDILDTVKHHRHVKSTEEWWRDGMDKLLNLIENNTEIWLTPKELSEGSHCTINGEVWPCKVEPDPWDDYDRLGISTGDKQYIAFRDAEEAGRAARDYWRDMAENDPKEFACIVGEETLVAWELDRLAGPGSTQVRSLDEWFDLWLDTPHEQWANYDFQECELKLCPALIDEHGEYIAAYRTN